MPEVQPPNRVLVVDDHEDCADSLAQLLDLRGYESAVAYDGLQAIALAREAPPSRRHSRHRNAQDERV